MTDGILEMLVLLLLVLSRSLRRYLIPNLLLFLDWKSLILLQFGLQRINLFRWLKEVLVGICDLTPTFLSCSGFTHVRIGSHVIDIVGAVVVIDVRDGWLRRRCFTTSSLRSDFLNCLLILVFCFGLASILGLLHATWHLVWTVDYGLERHSRGSLCRWDSVYHRSADIDLHRG